MADTVTPAPARRNWLKIIGIVLLVLLLLIVVFYFVATSSGFIKSVILPKVGKSLGSEITASDVSLSPFKQIIIKDLKVTPNGRETLMTAAEVKVQYRLMDIIKGNYNLDLISVTTPVIALVQRPDKTSNLDPVTEAMGPGSDDPMNLRIGKMVISNGTIIYEQQPSAEGSSKVELAGLNVNIDELKTGGVGKIAIDASLKMASTAPAPGTNGTMAATIKGALDVGLTPMLAPNVLKGNTRVDVTAAEGGYAMAKGMAIVFDADVTPDAVKQLALRLLQGQNTLAELAASGPFSLEKNEGTLDVRLSNVDRQALNFATAGSGMDFGKSSLSSTNTIRMTDGGKNMTVAGGFFANNLQVTITNQSSPVMNFRAMYDMTIDQVKSNAVVRVLDLAGNQSGKDFLKGGLTAPMNINWGSPAGGAPDSTFTLNLAGFNLADWKAFVGPSLSSGLIDANVEVATKEAGQQIVFKHNVSLRDLTLVMETNTVAGLNVLLSGDGNARQMTNFVSNYKLEMLQRDARALEVSGSGQYNTASSEGRGSAKGSASIPVLMAIAAIPDTKLSSGAANFDVAVQMKGDSQELKGNFNVAQLTGNVGSNVFQNFAVVGRMDALVKGDRAELRTTTMELSQAGKPGGSVEMTGAYGMSNSVAQFKMTIKDLNQNVLSSFLQGALGDKTLTSIAVNGQASANYDPEKPSAIGADFKVTNFVVKDPKGVVPGKPLEIGMALDSSINKNVLEIRKAALTLTPTDRAKNVLQVTGKVDMSNTNFTSGNVKIAADSLDLTTYYDLFDNPAADTAAQPATTSSTTGQGTSGQPSQSQPEQEAEPMVLPMTNFVVEASIGRLILREVDITNFVANTAIDGGRVRVNPFQMSINGAPMKSTVNLDLAVPGYRYDVDFSMNQVPFAPLVNTFTPERKGQMSGTLTAGLQVKGAGTTGASLQKNLNGGFNFGVTNMNFSIGEIKSPLLKTIINVIAIVPNIVKNPNAAGLSSLTGALLGGRTGTSTAVGGWEQALTGSPINIVAAQGSMGGGVVNLTSASLQSDAFHADTKGTVQLAKVLTNSTINFPLSVTIRRSLAESANLVPPNTPTNVTMVKLPDYVAVKGTVGEPKADINKMALLGTALQQYGGNIPGVDAKTGNIIQGLGGILTGRRGATNAAPATGTNAPAQGTNTTTGGGGLLQGLGGILGGGATQPAVTNAPATGTTTNSAATNNPVGNLIQGIFGPRKK